MTEGCDDDDEEEDEDDEGKDEDLSEGEEVVVAKLLSQLT